MFNHFKILQQDYLQSTVLQSFDLRYILSQLEVTHSLVVEASARSFLRLSRALLSG